ncbi:MAG: VWA domain-containing protein [Deltaproteobacteria bacterium]|jgi:Ca-activated chloride channel family protein|nr:VWA domain-containing protein [Deltaproteobacteria bacterium]
MSWANFNEFKSLTGWGVWGIILLIAAIFVWVIGYTLQKYSRKKLGQLNLIDKLISQRSDFLRILRPVLILAAFILLLIAYAKPQTSGKTHQVSEIGLDIIVALDFSKSMNVQDMHGSRLEHAKRELSRLIDDLGGDRIGLIAFAGTPMTYPLTTDYESAKMFWENLHPEDMPLGGTAIGRALNSAKQLLVEVRDPKKERAQIVILLSDGEDLASAPLKIAKKMSDLGIRIYTVGIGSEDGALVPMLTENGNTTGYVKHGDNYITSKLDQKLLIDIAKTTSGKYFRATKKDFGTQKILKSIKKLKKSEGEKRKIKEYNEEFKWFLVPAFFLLLLEFGLLGDKKLFRTQEN